jgi:hypothetical protein
MRAEAGADVYGGEAGEGDALGVLDDEMGVAVAVGVFALYVDDAADGFAAGGVTRRAMRGGWARGCAGGGSDEAQEEVEDHIR